MKYNLVYLWQGRGTGCVTPFFENTNIELESDLLTQRMELTHKIEAGTATDEEIREDEQKEFEFAAKYF